MSDTTDGISVSAARALVTRRIFIGNTIAVAGGAALAAMPILPAAAKTLAAALPKSEAPILTFDSYFTGWPAYDFGGTAQPYVPPAGHQPGAGLAAMSDEEFHRHHIFL